MKKLLIILCLPLVMLSCKNGSDTSKESSDAAEKRASDLVNLHLMGAVKSVEETPYTPDENGKIAEMDSCCVEVYEFSEGGMIVSGTEKTDAGDVKAVDVWEYTEDRNFVSRHRSEGGKIVWKRIIERDENGQPIRVVDYDSTEQSTGYHTIETLNDNGQGTYGKSYDSVGTYLGDWTWEYIDGLRAGRSWTDSSGVKLLDRKAEVNDKGWLSKVVETRVDEDSKATITTIETYTYDSFDDMGNWTQRTEYNDDKPVQVLKRSYTYY